MRIASWNLAHKAPDRYHGKENRRRQWALLGALDVDVALLQECHVEDLEDFAPKWMADEYDVLGPRGSKWKGSAAILAKRSLNAQPLRLPHEPGGEHRWEASLAENVVMASVSHQGEQLSIASVYADAREIVNPALTDDDHQVLKRPALARAWSCDWAAAAVEMTILDGTFIFGGDWNNARLFDVTEPKSAPASQQFFERRAARGWHDVMRKFTDSEVRTYLGSKRDFELDHFFADPVTLEAVTACGVLNDPALLELSDHKVLVAEVG